ncbi:hypothetical protein RvY_15056-2 [Ramazzottius varieornatus]|uniref:Uncharacterized protein n=1 Tax=Ramazzottius varieornatus TaxID=947166 RepID=A0A1D1VTI5_RAMVA|nr:hypothetical protein RvY_15056-2 [Ramazzottius varieornatus]
MNAHWWIPFGGIGKKQVLGTPARTLCTFVIQRSVSIIIMHWTAVLFSAFYVAIFCTGSLYAERDPDDHSRDRDGYPGLVKRSSGNTELDDDIHQYHSRTNSHLTRDLLPVCTFLNGTWYNQHKSKLILRRLANSAYPIAFGGSFQTRVHLPGCNDTDKLR